MFLFQDFCFVIKEKTREMDTETHFKVFSAKIIFQTRDREDREANIKNVLTVHPVWQAVYLTEGLTIFFLHFLVMWEHERVSGHFSGVQQGRRRLYSRRWDEVCAQASARKGWIEIYLSCQSLKGVWWIGQCTLSSPLSSNKLAKRASQVEHISACFDIYLGDLQRDWWNDRDSRQERRRQDQLFWIQVQGFSDKKDFQKTNIFRQINVPK